MNYFMGGILIVSYTALWAQLLLNTELFSPSDRM
jgi:hypothetical protein